MPHLIRDYMNGIRIPKHIPLKTYLSELSFDITNMSCNCLIQQYSKRIQIKPT